MIYKWLNPVPITSKTLPENPFIKRNISPENEEIMDTSILSITRFNKC